MGDHVADAGTVPRSVSGISWPWVDASRRRLGLAAALVVLNLADVLTTRVVLASGGIEANPLMVGLMQGLAAPLLLKTAVAGVAGLLLLCCPPASRRSERATATVVGIYLAVVVWNLGVFVLLQLQ
jgi:hypothetical protein